MLPELSLSSQVLALPCFPVAPKNRSMPTAMAYHTANSWLAQRKFRYEYVQKD